MSMNPISSSQPGDFQAQTFSWLEDQSSEINVLDFTHLAAISTRVPDPVGERWFLGLTPEGVNTVPGLPSPAKSSPSEPENVTRQASDSDQAVDNITVKAPYNTPRKRPGRYKNAPAHILNRRREQCRVAQQKHRERKDNRIAQLEKELKSLKEEYQTVLNGYIILNKAYKAFVSEVSANLVEVNTHVSGLLIGEVDTEVNASILDYGEHIFAEIGLSDPLI